MASKGGAALNVCVKEGGVWESITFDKKPSERPSVTGEKVTYRGKREGQEVRVDVYVANVAVVEIVADAEKGASDGGGE